MFVSFLQVVALCEGDLTQKEADELFSKAKQEHAKSADSSVSSLSNQWLKYELDGLAVNASTSIAPTNISIRSLLFRWILRRKMQKAPLIPKWYSVVRTKDEVKANRFQSRIQLRRRRRRSFRKISQERTTSSQWKITDFCLLEMTKMKMMNSYSMEVVSTASTLIYNFIIKVRQLMIGCPEPPISPHEHFMSGFFQTHRGEIIIANCSIDLRMNLLKLLASNLECLLRRKWILFTGGIHVRILKWSISCVI